MRQKWITALVALTCAAGASFGATSVNLEFNGSGNNLAATGFENAYNLDPTGFTVGGGSLTITTLPGDIYGGYEGDPDSAKNVFYTTIDPLYSTTVEAKVTYTGLHSNYHGGGIWMGTDEDHYVRFGAINNSNVPGIVIECIRENEDLWNNPPEWYGPGGDIAGQQSVSLAATPLAEPLTVYLRLVRTANSVTAYYSLDGTTYTNLVTFNDVAIGPNSAYPHIEGDGSYKVGTFAFGGGDPPATVAFDYFHAQSAPADHPIVELTSANGYNWYLKAGAGDASYAGTTLDERTDTSWVARDVPDRDWGNGPGDDGLGVPGAPVYPRTMAYGWYRAHFTTPPSVLSVPDRKVQLRIRVLRGEAVGDVDAVYINGTQVGSTGGFPTTATTPGPVNDPLDTYPNYYPGLVAAQGYERVYTFPASLLTNGTDANVIAVKVFNRAGAGGLIGVPVLETAPPTATVSGTVTSGGNPAANVRVAAMDAAGITSDAALTDAQGKFTLYAVKPGSVTLGATKPGLVSASKSLGSLADAQTSSGVTIDLAAVGQSTPAFFDDFDDGPNGWQTKWDVLSFVAPEQANDPTATSHPTITEPGYDVNTLQTIPSSLTFATGDRERGGIMTKERFSHVASVNTARLISAPMFLGGANNDGSPNIIMHLNGSPVEDVTDLPGYGGYGYVEFDMEGSGHALAPDGSDMGLRVQWIAFLNGQPNVRGVVPFPLGSPAELTKDNPLDITVARTGSFYDFYLNGERVFGTNYPNPDMADHKVALYSFSSAYGMQTYDWVRVSAPGIVLPPDTTKATRALRIAGGLEAADAAAVTDLNVAGGDNSVTVLDAVKLLQTAVNP